MEFSVRLGVPEMDRLWSDLSQKAKDGKLSNEEKTLYNKWGNAMKKLSQNPLHPSLHSHDIDQLSERYGMKVWQSYLENRKSRALRMFWVYGPGKQEITVIGMEPHPDTAKKNSYDKVKLSDLYDAES